MKRGQINRSANAGVVGICFPSIVLLGLVSAAHYEEQVLILAVLPLERRLLLTDHIA